MTQKPLKLVMKPKLPQLVMTQEPFQLVMKPSMAQTAGAQPPPLVSSPHPELSASPPLQETELNTPPQEMDPLKAMALHAQPPKPLPFDPYESFDSDDYDETADEYLKTDKSQQPAEPEPHQKYKMTREDRMDRLLDDLDAPSFDEHGNIRMPPKGYPTRRPWWEKRGL